MDPSRALHLLDLLARHTDGDLPSRLCAVAMELLEADGAGLAVLGDGLLTSLAAKGSGREGDGMQADLGEGPAYDAAASGRPVAAPEIGSSPWPVLGPRLASRGMRSAFAFPVQQGAVRLGVLSVYRSAGGPLTDAQHADGLALSRLAVDVLTWGRNGLRSEVAATLAAEPADRAWVVHQASGMVSVQLGMSVADALATMRAHAYSQGRSLNEVAADIVARRLRLGGTGT